MSPGRRYVSAPRSDGRMALERAKRRYTVVIGIALLGAGYAGRIQIDGWRRIPGVRVVGIWNRSAERAGQLAAEYGVEHFLDLDALIQHPAVDAVDIATAMETHRGYADRAAAAGKHVLCQKPLAGSLAEAEAIVADCAAAGVRLMTNENWRWRPWYRAARAALDRGALGRPFSLRLTLRTAAAVATPDRPPDRLFARQPFLRTMQPLILLELGPHHLDVTRYLFGEPHDVYARTLKVRPSAHVAGEEVATVHLDYPDRVAQIYLSWASVGAPEDVVHPDTAVIEGTEGTLTIDPDGRVRIQYRDGSANDEPVDAADAYQWSWTAALAHFADCLVHETPFETSGEDNLRTLRLVFAAYASAASGQPISIQ